MLYEKELPTDSVKQLYENSVRNKNLVGQMLFAIEVGKRMRNMSQYTDAMLYHQKGLNAALNLRDTIVAAQAWNHLGTDSRRIGALAEASDYWRSLVNVSSEEFFKLVNDAGVASLQNDLPGADSDAEGGEIM